MRKSICGFNFWARAQCLLEGSGLKRIIRIGSVYPTIWQTCEPFASSSPGQRFGRPTVPESNNWREETTTKGRAWEGQRRVSQANTRKIEDFQVMECEMETDTGNVDIAPPNDLLQWSQWQLLDSILPTGGFAHSYGIEAAIQTRIVLGPEDLKSYIIHILDNTASLLLPFVYSACKSPDVETWAKLDKELEATLTNEVSRKASSSQGSALLRVAASVFVEVPSLKKIRDTFLGCGTVSFHYAPVFGLMCGLLGFDSSTSQRAFMFITMRDAISAATRLNLIGPLGASVLQHQIAHVAEEMVKKWMDRPIEEACQTAPLLDIVQGCHGYLFSRLFCS